MAEIKIYTSMFCGYCAAAKRLLQKKGATFEEVDVGFTRGAREEMEARADGRTSVPQIFIGETHVGGFDDLVELDQEGALDPMLAQN